LFFLGDAKKELNENQKDPEEKKERIISTNIYSLAYIIGIFLFDSFYLF
jgi:hypothetical protein